MTDPTDARDLLEQAVLEAYPRLDYSDQGWIARLPSTPSGATLLARADEATALRAEVERLRSALAPWVRDDPWVPSAWEEVKPIQWECYACEATITLPPRPLSLTGPDEAWHIDGTGREERCRWLVARAALAAPEPAAAPTPAGHALTNDCIGGGCVDCEAGEAPAGVDP